MSSKEDSYLVEPGPDLIVIETYDNGKEVYFRAFLGEHSGEYKTESENQQYLEEVRKSISLERIKGKNLEKIIIELLREYMRNQDEHH
ncbi:MAG: hypothetical protein AABX44_02305 [Nanoarchaeota archaeon]